MYTESEVLDFVREEDVKFIRLAFFDIMGIQKNISIMPGELHRAFTEGISFDASSVRGFESAEKSDLFLFPDPSTLSILPWRPSTGKVVRMFCDIKYPDGRSYEKDCRFILKSAIKKLEEDCGISLRFGAEVEFYLFKLDENGNVTDIPFDNAGYMDIAPEDKGENIRREICFTLEAMGISPEASHHEAGPGQNEIDFRYSDALSCADNTSTFKWIVRTKAAANGLYASFSPKPLEDKSGSGFHINISCAEKSSLGGKKTAVSKERLLQNMIAGILKYIEEMTFFLNPTAESYLRLGYSAPSVIAWGNQNRSTVIRLPAVKAEQRLELRSPDPEANPYIAFALLICAAAEGILNDLEPPAALEKNLFSKEVAVDCKRLPESVEVAFAKAMESEFVKSVLGERLLKAFCAEFKR